MDILISISDILMGIIMLLIISGIIGLILETRKGRIEQGIQIFTLCIICGILVLMLGVFASTQQILKQTQQKTQYQQQQKQPVDIPNIYRL